MTGPTAPTAASASRGARKISPARLAELRKHVIVIPDGRPSATSTPKPKTVDEFETTADDIREIVDTHLAAFIDDYEGPGPVPVVVYAHGGLVSKQSGFEIADHQVDWWLANGVFPIEIVWETGALTALADAWERYRPGGTRGWTDVTDGVIEVALRALGGRATWEDMKLDAAAASVPGGGGAVLAEALAAFMESDANVALHAVGHSAGSIFHTHFVPTAITAGVPKVESVTFLAPAVRIDTFEKLLLPLAEEGRIGELSIFTMKDELELGDSCLGAYRKSLLYLVSGSFEPERGAAILGIREHLVASARTRVYFDDGDERLVLSKRGGDPRSSSSADTHGGFDDDPETMQSVALRVAVTDQVRAFPVRGGARSTDEETGGAIGATAGSRSVSADASPTPSDAGPATARAPQKRALCIGIDAYPGRDALKGAVADSLAWAKALDDTGFEVRELHDDEATRDAMISEIIALVSASAAGDSLVIQYAGHGTFVPDLDGDDEDRADEALCPVDFRANSVILDDELAAVWDLIPEGVAVTLVFDCCHSGTASRRVDDAPPQPVGDSRPRLTALTKEEQEAYRRRNGAPTDTEWQVEAHARVVDSEPGRAPKSPLGRTAIQRREVLIAACADDEVAWENRGQGVFTRAALEVLGRDGAITNRAFVDAVVDSLGPNRVQNPKLTADELASARVLFAPVLGTDEPEPPRPGHDDRGIRAGAARSRDEQRAAAIAMILRGTADLLEAEARRD